MDDDGARPSDLAARLGLAPAAASRLDLLPPGPRVSLPPDAEARDLLTLCSVSAEDQDAMLGARPEPESDWWWLLRGTVGEMLGRMDEPLPPEGYASWPTVPAASGPVGMFLYAWALICVLPTLLAVHERRGIGRDVTAASVHSLGGVMSSHLDVTGIRGVGLFPLWGPPQEFSGADVTLGRHSFTRTEMAFGDGPAGWALQVHIAPAGSLEASGSADSIGRALEFFARYYPEEPIAALVCKSWLLDPQLRAYLPAESNILRFQAGWHVLPLVPLDDEWEGDREFLRLGLQVRTPDSGPLTEEHLAGVPNDTRLQRGFLDLIRAGGHWHKREAVRWLVG